MFKRKFYNKNPTNSAFNQFLIIDLVLISKHAMNPSTYRVVFKFFSSTYIGVFIFKRIFNKICRFNNIPRNRYCKISRALERVSSLILQFRVFKIKPTITERTKLKQKMINVL